MLTPKNNASALRTEILRQVAKSFLADRFAGIDQIPSLVRPDNSQPLRGSLEADRTYVKYAAIAALGFDPDIEDGADISLTQYTQKALERTSAAPSVLSVIKASCAACMTQRYLVSNNCRACLARPCMLNCPKQAIDVKAQAVIDQSKCVKCGRCADVCPYNAIIKVPLPCEDACPVGAITKGEDGREHIDHSKCISCGKCLNSCPFGVIVETSQMVDVLRELHTPEHKVVAMLAPAVLGQYPGSINNLVGALQKLGFSHVIEVAVGADITTIKEAAEFVEKAKRGEQLMTTSCCPAYFKAAEIHIPEIQPYVSHTKTPMYYIAEIVKNKMPDCLTVFVGPCLAKRIEAEKNPNVDYVWVFEELAAVLAGSGIDVNTCEASGFEHVASAQGRIYPITGGVAGAVAHIIGDKIPCKREAIDGLNKEAFRKLKMYAAKKSAGEFNLIEVMCCEGGCVGGPGCVVTPKKSAVMVENYVKASPDLKDMQGNK